MALNEFLLKLSEWLGVVAVSMIAGVSPRFRARPLMFKYPQREAFFSLLLLGGILLTALLFPLLGAGESLQVRPFTMNPGEPITRLRYRITGLPDGKQWRPVPAPAAGAQP